MKSNPSKVFFILISIALLLTSCSKDDVVSQTIDTSKTAQLESIDDDSGIYFESFEYKNTLQDNIR